MRVLSIFVLLIYGTATMGATVHMHFCMNEFVGSSLWHGEKDAECDKCGMKEKKGGCCRDEYKQIKLKSEHQKTTLAKLVESSDAPALLASFASPIFQAIPILSSLPVSNAPPKIPKERLFIFQCLFLI